MRFVFVSLIVLVVASPVWPQQPGAQDRVSATKLLGKFCFECHDSETREADVSLATFSNPTTFLEDRRVWLRAAEVIESGTMPPESSRQPTHAERETLLKWVTSSLEDVDWASVRAPGRVPLTRLTRDEFRFAAEDLFGIRVELDEMLPADPEGPSGFANDHTSLLMTAKQLDRFFKAAEVVAACAVDQALGASQVLHYEVEDGTNASFNKRISKGPDGSLGWTFSSKLGSKYQAVSKSFYFERTGFYRVRMRALSKGPGKNAAAWIAVDSVNDASRETGILVPGQDFAVHETELFLTQGHHRILLGYDFYGPLWLPKSPERPQMKLGQSTFDPPPYEPQGWLPNGLTVADLNAKGLHIADQDHDDAAELLSTINGGYFTAVLDNLMLHRFHYEKGYLPVFLAGLGYDYQESVVPALNALAKLAETDRSKLEQHLQSHEPDEYEALRQIAELQREAWSQQDRDRKQQVGDLFVDWIEFESLAGKGGQKSRSNNREQETPTPFLGIPESGAGVAGYLDLLLPRVTRRATGEEDRNRFLTLYQEERGAGANHRDALQRMLVAILVSPEFLYRTDGPAKEVGVARLDGNPLASRLSSFLWSSIPDQELMQAVTNTQLASCIALDRQVDRMLDHERRIRFSRAFTQQWLNLGDMGRGKEPDKELFRYFSWRLAQDMREEVALLFDRVLREDRSILELIDSKTTFLNERLARLYGIEDIAGPTFRSVELQDPRRGGLLGTAAVLTSTSLATRTSPVRRGQFVLETVLGVELPRPPADVPQLDDEAGQSRQISLRDSLAHHRRDPSCAGCHNRIDPLGFALENFDWIGRWRDSDPAGPVDSSARLPNGRQLSGVSDLKTFLIAERADEFTAALTRAMLKYALGRDLDYFDEHTVEDIVSQVKADDYRARTLVKTIVRSYPFCFREIKERHEQ